MDLNTIVNAITVVGGLILIMLAVAFIFMMAAVAYYFAYKRPKGIENLKYLHHHQYLMYWLIYQTQEFHLLKEKEEHLVEVEQYKAQVEQEYHLIEQVVEGVDLVHLW